jgi:hypothetical protein
VFRPVQPQNCCFPTGAGSLAVSENCAVSVVEFKGELNSFRDLTPLL